MNLLGNVLWIVFGGAIAIFLEYVIAGIVLCISIVGIPFGVQCFKLAGFSLFPFGRVIVTMPASSTPLYLILNIVWLVFAGLWIALTHVILAAICAISIIGIPFGYQHLKLAMLALMPFGKDLG